MHGSVLALVGAGSATVALFLPPWYWAGYFLSFALNFVFVCLLSPPRLERQVPPAMFHTLVENAITHAPAGAITLRLSARNDHHRTHYIFESPAGSEESGNGGGTKYIEARLREAWGERWTFQQGRAGAMWRTEIVVPS